MYELLIERERASTDQSEKEKWFEQVKLSLEANNFEGTAHLVRLLRGRYPEDKAALELEERLRDPNFNPVLVLLDK